MAELGYIWSNILVVLWSNYSNLNCKSLEDLMSLTSFTESSMMRPADTSMNGSLAQLKFRGDFIYFF